MKVFYISLVVFAFVFSCKPNNSKDSNAEKMAEEATDSLATSEEDLYKEVMDVHDNLMEKMSDLMALNKKIKQSAESKEEGEEKKRIMELSASLEEANEGMMNWMRKFNPNLEKMNHQETLSYLTTEKEKINQVKTDMETAQKNAEDYLKEVH